MFETDKKVLHSKGSENNENEDLSSQSTEFC